MKKILKNELRIKESIVNGLESITKSEKVNGNCIIGDCVYCNNALTQCQDKVRDHDHLNGKYRGASHNSCNINAKQCNFVPVFFHNLSGYDAHFIIREMGKYKIKTKILAKDTENYIAFDIGCLRFLDSYKFLSNS